MCLLKTPYYHFTADWTMCNRLFESSSYYCSCDPTYTHQPTIAHIPSARWVWAHQLILV